MGILSDLHNDLERGAFQLIVEYRARLHAAAVTLCGDSSSADDLVFRTFEKVLSRADSYKDDVNLFGWMMTIMTNIHRDDMKSPVVRGTKTVAPEDLEQYAGADWSTDEQILRNSDCEAVRAALSNLDPKYRQVLIMRYYEDLSLKEIASFLKKPVGTVGRRIHVALHLLAGKLEAEFGKAKKSLALLGAILLGATTLFGAYQTGLVDAVKSYFASEEPAPVVETPVAAPAPIVEDSEPTETVAASAPPAAEIAADSSEFPAEIDSFETTTNKRNEKENGEMNLTKTIKLTVLSAAVMLSAGSAGASTLPDGYTRLDYIQGDGKAWIASGVYPTADLVVKMTMEQTTENKNASGERALFGNKWSTTGYIPIFTGSGQTIDFYSNGGHIPYSLVNLNVLYHLTFDATGMTVVIGDATDETRCNLPSPTFSANNAPLRIFSSDDSHNPSLYRLYSMTMTVAGVCVREFVPAKDSDGNVGLYDIVDHSGEPGYEPFYKSSVADSNFIAGPAYVEDPSPKFSADVTSIGETTAEVTLKLPSVGDGATRATVSYAVAPMGEELPDPTTIESAATAGWTGNVTISGLEKSKRYVLRFSAQNDLNVVSNVEHKIITRTGLKVTVIGDSYSTYAGTMPAGYENWYTGSNNGVTSVEKTWWKQFINRIGGTLEKNNSWSGSKVCGSVESAMISSSRLAELGNPDIILICGGTNDAWQNATIGEITYHDNLADYTLSEKLIFAPAFAYLIQYLKTNFPKAGIVVVINSHDDGSAGINENYCNVMATVAKRFGVPSVQLHDISKSGKHPDAAGMTAMADQVFETWVDQVDYSTLFVVGAAPQEINSTESPIRYGIVKVTSGQSLSVPATLHFNTINYRCAGYKLYQYVEADGIYVEMPERAGTGNSFTVQANDVGAGRKLEWQWEARYLISIAAGEDGQVKVTTNGVTTTAADSWDLWLAAGTPVSVEYVPKTENDWRFLSGAPTGAKYQSPSAVSFAMPGEQVTMTAGQFPYSDENILSQVAPTSSGTNYGALVTYAFATPTVEFPVFARRPITLEERDGSCRALAVNDSLVITPEGPTSVSISIGDNTAKRFEFEPFTAHPIASGSASPSPVVSLNGTVLVKDVDYELYYENATAVGEATMVIVGKAGTAAEGLAQRFGFTAANVCFVTPMGTGDGSSWANAVGLVDAVSGSASGNCEIWCQAGTYDLSGVSTGIVLSHETAIRGGFAGDATDVTRKASDGSKTVFDGGEVATKLFESAYSCATADFATKPIVFEDCAFSHCVGTAVYSSGRATPFAFKNCDFRSNAAGSTSAGIAFYISGASLAPVGFTNCRFEGNVNTSRTTQSVLYLSGAKFTVDGCLFVTNGAPLSETTTKFDNSTSTRLVYSTVCAADSKVSNCDFRGNFFTRWCNACYGVYVNNTKATIENCRFVGNSFWNTFGAYNQADALVMVGSGSASTPVAIRNCTFAYNALDACGDWSSCVRADGASPISVENCIFWQNVQDATNKGKRDFQGSNATLTYSLFAELETAGKCVNIAPGTGCITDDPLFVTPNQVADYLIQSSGRVRLDPAKIDDILAIDVHLRSSEGYRKSGDAEWHTDTTDLSPAIDAGDPDADYANEPNPNGKRVNMGGYGNTAEASKTPFCDPEIVSVTVDYPDGLTQPRITMQVGGEGVFVGTAVFYYSTDDGTTYVASEPVTGATNGGTVIWSVPFFAESGAKIKYYATLSAAGAETKTSTVGDSTATGVKPPWENPGDVVLVTTNGTPTGSGQSWANSIDLATAINNLAKNPNSEIWLKAETFALTNGTLDIRAAGKIRGGFAADNPTDLAKRSAGAKTVFDGANIATCFFNSYYNCAAADFATKPIVFEDCAFSHCVGTAVYSSGRATPFAFKNCDFRSNAAGSTSAGIAFYISGASSAPVGFTNCRFEGNVNTTSSAKSLLSFAAAKFAVDGCQFVTNGAPLTGTTAHYGNETSTRLISGSGCAADSKVSNCDFRGNFFTRYCNACYGVYVNNTKATIENCRFVGNSFWNTFGVYNRADAIVGVESGSASTPVAIRNCTFAYNALDACGDWSSCVRADGASPISVENCIFWQNVQDATNKGKRDFDGSNATLTYSLFAELETAGSCVNVEPGAGCITDDPLFVTTNPIADYLKTGLAAGRVALDPAKINEILAIDVHLKRFSPCVNKGNPASDYSQEPKPNGKRINMGAYGGTSEAACTPPGMAVRIR